MPTAAETWVGRMILNAVYRSGQMATLAEIMQVVQVPDLAVHVDALAPRYLRYMTEDRVALTTVGLDLVQGGPVG